MKIQTMNTPAGPTPPPEPPKKPEIENYTGPQDGLSHYDADAARWIRPLNKAVVHLWMHKEVEGAEKIPKEGSHLLCFSHHSYSDASLMQSITDRDYRFMAAKEQFTGIIGTLMTKMGTFPVDRKGDPRKPIEVMTNILDSGLGGAIAPQGGIRPDLTEFKEGPALMALRSKCETMVPVVLHYTDHKATVGEKLATYGTTAAIVAGGLAAAIGGGPVARAVSGVLTGAVSGATVGGAIAFSRGAGKDIKERIMDSLPAAGYGALAGAAVGGVGNVALGDRAIWLAAPMTVTTGAVGLALAKGYNERKDAYVVVGDAVKVEPYRQMENKKEAREKLTTDLYNQMLAIKTKMKEEHGT